MGSKIFNHFKEIWQYRVGPRNILGIFLTAIAKILFVDERLGMVSVTF